FPEITFYPYPGRVDTDQETIFPGHGGPVVPGGVPGALLWVLWGLRCGWGGSAAQDQRGGELEGCFWGDIPALLRGDGQARGAAVCRLGGSGEADYGRGAGGCVRERLSC